MGVCGSEVLSERPPGETLAGGLMASGQAVHSRGRRLDGPEMSLGFGGPADHRGSCESAPARATYVGRGAVGGAQNAWARLASTLGRGVKLVVRGVKNSADNSEFSS